LEDGCGQIGIRKKKFSKTETRREDGKINISSIPGNFLVLIEAQAAIGDLH